MIDLLGSVSPLAFLAFQFAPGFLSPASKAGYTINNSLRLRSSAPAYMSQSCGAGGTDQYYIFNVKLGTLGTTRTLCSVAFTSTVRDGFIAFNSSDQLYIYDQVGTSVNQRVSNRVFRDPIGHGQLFVAITPGAAVGSRIRAWWNGEEITWGTNSDTHVTSAYADAVNQYIGVGSDASSNYFDGILSDCYRIDGQSVTYADFGQLDANNNWNPIAYSGAFGAEGWHLNFSDPTSTTTIGYDVSGNANHFTASGISVTAGVTYDVMKDTPTNGSPSLDTGAGGELPGNYATLSAIGKHSSATVLGGGLATYAGASAFYAAPATMPCIDGKIYVEAQEQVSGQLFAFGIFDAANFEPVGTQAPESTAYGYAILCNGAGTYVTRANGADTNARSADTTASVFQIAFDPATGYLWLGRDNAWFGGGNPATGTSPTYTLAAFQPWTIYAVGGASSAQNLYVNFGQRPFAYGAPSGFGVLCTANLPDPAIPNPADHFDALLYSGDGATTNRAITGINFQPDLSWFKSRSAIASNVLIDAVRGGTFPSLYSDLVNAELYEAEFVSFDTNGFTIKKNVSYDRLNSAAGSYISWNWKAGGAPIANTNGSITSSVSANPTAGFSIVSWTGTGALGTIGHGLSSAPDFIIIKRTDAAGNDWITYHSGLSATRHIWLDLTNAAVTSSAAWNNTAPSSLVFTVNTSGDANTSGGTYVAYCFASISSFSAFGSYTGNGSADGPFVFCGFRSRYLLVKRIDVAGTWYVFDTKRDPYNGVQYQLYPNASTAEGSGTIRFDILSNGFKVRNTSADHNANGGTYIYAAFAEHPFKTAMAR